MNLPFTKKEEKPDKKEDNQKEGWGVTFIDLEEPKEEKND